MTVGLRKCETLLLSPLPSPFCIPAPSIPAPVMFKEEGEKGKEMVLEKDRKVIESAPRRESVSDEEMKLTEAAEERRVDIIVLKITKIKDEDHDNKSTAEEGTQMEVVKEVVESPDAVYEMNRDLVSGSDCVPEGQSMVEVIAEERMQDSDRDRDGDRSTGQIVEIEGETKGKASGNTITVAGVNEGLGLSDNSMSRLCCAFILYGCPLQISPKGDEIDGTEVGFVPTVIPLSRLNVLGMRVHTANAPNTETSSTCSVGKLEIEKVIEEKMKSDIHRGTSSILEIEMFDLEKFIKISGINVCESDLSDFYRTIWLPFCCSIFKKSIPLSHLYKKIVPSPLKKIADHHIATRGKHIFFPNVLDTF